VSLVTPETVRKLQTTLHVKAKESSSFRFYTLYDKIYRRDVLAFAFRICRVNGGAPGVDGQTFEDVLEYGEGKWLEELAEELRTKSYRPSAVRRVFIPKPGQKGKVRPLGIPTIKDRVAMTAALLVLESIFETDLQPEQYAYRPNRSALDAVSQVYGLLRNRHWHVVEADLSGYFDSIPHSDLLKSIARRVCDRQMLHLIKMWLQAPIEETDKRGRKRRTTVNKDAGRGTPQGSPISPLFSNLYMRRFILGWKVLGHERRFRAKIVNYADDFVICCAGPADAAMAAMRDMMRKLKLTINEEKRDICRLPDEKFDFLGYTFGRCYSPKTGRRYIGTRPSNKKVQSICRRISEWTDRRWVWIEHSEQAERLNHAMRGWANYFHLGPVSKPYRRITYHAYLKLRQWLCNKHKVETTGTARYPDQYLHERLGLIDLTELTRDFPWAKT
jgi:RNA-directed DNA polymerase